MDLFDPLVWADIKEKINFFAPMLTPLLLWFSGKFLLDKWDKRKKDIEIKRMENQADLDDTLQKQKEADLLLIYEGMIKRASDEAITKSDRWRKIEDEWSTRFDKLEVRVSDQNKELSGLRLENSNMSSEISLLKEKIADQTKEIAVLRSENICLNLEISTLKASKVSLEVEKVKLEDRVRILEEELQTRNAHKEE